MEADGPGLAGARALKHAINGEHQTPSNARFSPSSLSLSVFPLSFCHRIYPIILAVVHQSASQSYESFSFTFRFRFQSICLAFLAVPPSLIQPLRRPPAAIDLRVGCFRNASCLPLFFCCSWLALSILCSVFKAAGKHSRANTSIESRCLLHF